MYIGVDLGGTNIAVGLVSEEAKIIAKMSTPTLPARGADAIVSDISASINTLLNNNSLTVSDISWVGIGSPGAINPSKGEVVFAGNLRFKNTPLAPMLKEKTGFPVFLGNDANAAALGEVYAGAGKEYSSFLMVTLGTGIGGGIVLNRRIFDGFNGCAGEVGHMVVEHDGRQCSCGRKGCWETYASATGLINLTKEAAEKYPDSVLAQMIARDGKVSGRTSFNAMRKGDKAGKEVVDAFISYLACGISNMINILQPEAVCIGGGVANEGNDLTLPLIDLVDKECFDCGQSRVKVCVAQLGNEAGIIGAAMLGKA